MNRVIRLVDRGVSFVMGSGDFSESVKSCERGMSIWCELVVVRVVPTYAGEVNVCRTRQVCYGYALRVFRNVYDELGIER